MSVEIGTEIPTWSMPVVDPQRMKTMAAILRDPYQVHWDHDAVAPITGGKVINQGPLNLSYIANMLMAWQGPTCIRRLQVRFTDWVLEGDEVMAHGRVTSIDDVDGERRATCEIRLARADGNATDGNAVVGTAVVALTEA
jgi:acyl dehydratase